MIFFICIFMYTDTNKYVYTQADIGTDFSMGLFNS